jgi:hypothetical protein
MVVVVCVRAARCRGMRFGSQTRASWLWRGGLQALGSRWRRRRRGRRDGEVDIHTVQTSGRRVRLYTDNSSGGRGGSSVPGRRGNSRRDPSTTKQAARGSEAGTRPVLGGWRPCE